MLARYFVSENSQKLQWNSMVAVAFCRIVTWYNGAVFQNLLTGAEKPAYRMDRIAFSVLRRLYPYLPQTSENPASFSAKMTVKTF